GFEGTIGGHSDGDRLSAWLRLHDITAVDVCGIATDYCVRATALDAASEGFSTRVLTALTAAVRPDDVPAVHAEFAVAGVTSAD
ncbi:MAG TPA: isochorismatase family protein, partial [Arachnia sp.]|nr:isochorismatase family protein [Arachnia sp.]